MKVVYPSTSDVIYEAENPHATIASLGSYWMIASDNPASSFCGCAFLDTKQYKMIKALHDIRPNDTCKEFKIIPGRTIRTFEHGQDEFFFHEQMACYFARGTRPVEVVADVRDTYNQSTEDRVHEIVSSYEHGVHITRIHCRAESVVLISSAPLEIAHEWKEFPTPFDESRGGASSWWARSIGKFTDQTVRLIITTEDNVYQAAQALHAQHLWGDTGEQWQDVLRQSAYESLHGLITHTPNMEMGILAGLPWFFQIYTRDEAISTGALITLGEHALASRILLREIGVILSNGRVPNRFPASNTGSADGVGWSFARLHEIYQTNPNVLSEKQWSFVYAQLTRSLERLARDEQTDFVLSGPKETWMDTTGDLPDDRRGARIEIQALTLRMLSFAAQLSKTEKESETNKWLAREANLKQSCQRFISSDGIIADGWLNGEVDFTVRPNIFLALYVYPDMFSQNDWVRGCNIAIEHLFLDWGGFASISKHSPMFHEFHSGQNDNSYHRGDSWFFLNNLAATALLRLDKKFGDVAQRICDASAKDLLEKGSLGDCSEISHSFKQAPLGCWVQAWSAASLIELLAALD